LLTNIRLGWKGLPGTNAVAYFVAALVTEEKKLYKNEKRFQRQKTFFSITDNEAKTFDPGKPFQSSLIFLGKATSLP
jgi:hypothetical protein